MPFREKSAWITLFTVGLVFGVYFAALAYFWDMPARGPLGVVMLIGAVVALTVIITILMILAAVTAPREANAPADERERLIDLKAERIASYLQSACVMLLIGALLLGWDGFLVANLLLAALVFSELAKAAAQIIFFRTGA